MTQPRWGVPAVLSALLALVAVLGAGAAQAADGDGIVGFARNATGLVVSVEVPEGTEVDLDRVSATVGGIDYDVPVAQPFGAGNSTVRRTTILAIDTSNSMSGAKFEAAKAAADLFLDVVPDDVYVGIVSFNSTITPFTPTQDRDAAQEIIDNLQLDRRTLLYDGVLASVELAGDVGLRNILLLSDGADTGDNGTLIDDVTEALSDSGVPVNVVGLNQRGNALGALETIAGDSGQVVNGTQAELADRFGEIAEGLGRQVAVTVAAPDDALAEPVSVEVTLPSATGDVVANALYVPGASSAPPTPLPSPNRAEDGPLPTWAMYAAVGLLGVGLLLAMVSFVPTGQALPRTPAARISSYTSSVLGGTAPPAQDQPALAQATEAIEGVLRRNRGLDERISGRLSAAGSALKPSEWLLLHCAIALGALAVGLLLGRGAAAVGLLFLILGIVLPWVYLGVRQSRRRRKFESALPETLQLMSGSLSAGLSLLQAVDTIVREGADPVSTEFRRVLVEIRLGIALDDALEGVAERFASRDFRWVVMAIRIQRQVGGNLAELLTTVSTTMREREYIRRQVSALAAEGKLSAIVLGALPPTFLLYLVVAQPSYVEPLFTDLRGIIMLLGGAVWLGVGIVWMSRLIRVEV